jgi:hypothetical protein
MTNLSLRTALMDYKVALESAIKRVNKLEVYSAMQLGFNPNVIYFRELTYVEDSITEKLISTDYKVSEDIKVEVGKLVFAASRLLINLFGVDIDKLASKFLELEEANLSDKVELVNYLYDKKLVEDTPYTALHIYNYLWGYNLTGLYFKFGFDADLVKSVLSREYITSLFMKNRNKNDVKRLRQFHRAIKRHQKVITTDIPDGINYNDVSYAFVYAIMNPINRFKLPVYKINITLDHYKLGDDTLPKLFKQAQSKKDVMYIYLYYYRQMVASGSKVNMRVIKEWVKSFRFKYFDFIVEKTDFNIQVPKVFEYIDLFNTKLKERDNLPDVSFEVELNGIKYRFRKATVAEGILSGEFTNCCQVIGGASGMLVYEVAYNEDISVYVVERNGNIVAQSTTFRYTGVDKNPIFVFDSVESKLGVNELYSIYDIFLEALNRYDEFKLGTTVLTYMESYHFRLKDKTIPLPKLYDEYKDREMVDLPVIEVPDRLRPQGVMVECYRDSKQFYI